jgi:hypothetical protein
MKKTIKLTESDLSNLVRRIIKEEKKNLSEFMFDTDPDGEMAEENKMDSFIKEVKETLVMGKHGKWDFFSKPTPRMTLNILISKVREICDDYEM